MQNVSLMDALHIVGVLSNTFWRPVTSNTIFVAQNTRAKRTELDAQAVQTFYLSNTSQTNDLNDIQTALRNVLTNAKLYAVPSQNAIVMRATPDELLLARKLIDDLDKARPEVVVDVAVLEVNRNQERNLGIILPQQISAHSAGPTTTTSTTDYHDYRHYHHHRNDYRHHEHDHQQQRSDAQQSRQSECEQRCHDHQLGDRESAADGQRHARAAEPAHPRHGRAESGLEDWLARSQSPPVRIRPAQPPRSSARWSTRSSSIKDVGVEIEITPTIHFDRDVSLKLKMAISQQSGTVNLSGINEPIFSQRTVDQTIRLREGEASILGGLLQQQLPKTTSPASPACRRFLC